MCCQTNDAELSHAPTRLRKFPIGANGKIMELSIAKTVTTIDLAQSFCLYIKHLIINI